MYMAIGNMYIIIKARTNHKSECDALEKTPTHTVDRSKPCFDGPSDATYDGQMAKRTLSKLTASTKTRYWWWPTLGMLFLRPTSTTDCV